MTAQPELEASYVNWGHGCMTKSRGSEEPVAEMAAMIGTDVAAHSRDRPSMSALAFEPRRGATKRAWRHNATTISTR